MVIIKLINDLNNLFKIYLIILSQKTRDKNKFLNLQVFFSNFKNKKHYIKEITNIISQLNIKTLG